MKNCQNCLENSWTFKNLDSGDVQATCKNCGYEVEWTPRYKQLSSKSHCCGKPTVLTKAKLKPKSFKGKWHYTAYYKCKKCRKVYYDNQFKVLNDNTSKKHLN